MRTANQERVPAQELLREKEAQYRGIFEATIDGLVIYDLQQGLIVEANTAFCTMHGYAREELVEQPPTLLIHPKYQDLFRRNFELVRAGGSFACEVVGLRKGGAPFHLELHGSQFLYRGAQHMLGVVRDVTERVQAYQTLEQCVQERTNELATLLRISHNVASTLDLKLLLGRILDQLSTLMDFTGAAILRLQGTELMLLDYRGPIPREQALGLRFPLDQSGANREVIAQRRPIVIADIRGETPLARHFRATAGAQLETTFAYIRSWMGVPLIANERLIGMLTLDYSEPDHYTEHHAQLAMAVATQAAVAIENARLYEQAQELAALQERQRLARELHDSVSQALYGIALGARTARTLLDRDPGRAAEPLDYVLSLAEAGLAEMRALIFELRPETLESEGLIAAISKQATSLRARHGIEVQTELCPEPNLPFESKVALYRIAQEAFHNIVKHARATQACLRLSCWEREIVLEIDDNGQGFDTSARYPGHFGLHTMRERVARLGGRLHIDSAPGQGTQVRAHIPR